MTPTKRCYSCPEGQQIKPRTAEFFKRDRTKPDGLHSRCKACEKKWTKDVYRPRVGRAKDIARAKERRQTAKQQAEQ